MNSDQLRRIGGENHDDVIDTWKTPGKRNFHYFEAVDDDARTAGFWTEGRPFRRLFDRLNIQSTVEVACGFGRHSSRIVDQCGRLVLVDTSAGAIAEARKRFHRFRHVEVLLSEDGMSIPAQNESMTAVFSYDAMVHFEPITVASYLHEAARVLAPGGKALFHHSNYEGNPTGAFQTSPSWRNYMSKNLFAHFASRAGLDIEDQVIFAWGGVADLDGLTLLSKPA